MEQATYRDDLVIRVQFFRTKDICGDDEVNVKFTYVTKPTETVITRRISWDKFKEKYDYVMTKNYSNPNISTYTKNCYKRITEEDNIISTIPLTYALCREDQLKVIRSLMDEFNKETFTFVTED